MLVYVTTTGIFIETLESDPSKYLPEVTEADTTGLVQINLDEGMDKVRSVLTQHGVKTRLSLTGTLVVARDIAHAKLQERLDAGDGLPQCVTSPPSSPPRRFNHLLGASSPLSLCVLRLFAVWTDAMMLAAVVVVIVIVMMMMVLCCCT